MLDLKWIIGDFSGKPSLQDIGIAFGGGSIIALIYKIKRSKFKNQKIRYLMDGKVNEKDYHGSNTNDYSIGFQNNDRVSPYIQSCCSQENIANFAKVSKVISGTSNEKLVDKICQQLGITKTNVEINRFCNNETSVEIKEDIQGKNVFIFQTGSGNVNDVLVESLLLIYCAKMEGAKRVVAVFPLFPYSRQDKTDNRRVPLSSKLVANMVSAAGADEVFTMDLHAPQIQGFFDIPCKNLISEPVIIHWLRNNFKEIKKLVLASPDAGGAKRVAHIADHLGISFVEFSKMRKRANEVSDMFLTGNCPKGNIEDASSTRDSPKRNLEGKDVVIIDDMADTCGTIILASKKLKEAGAKSVMAIITHGVFSNTLKGQANVTLVKLNESTLDKVLVANTVCQEDNMHQCSKIQIIDTSPIFANAMVSSVSQ